VARLQTPAGHLSQHRRKEQRVRITHQGDRDIVVCLLSKASSRSAALMPAKPPPKDDNAYRSRWSYRGLYSPQEAQKTIDGRLQKSPNSSPKNTQPN